LTSEIQRSRTTAVENTGKMCYLCLQTKMSPISPAVQEKLEIFSEVRKLRLEFQMFSNFSRNVCLNKGCNYAFLHTSH
jgi:hypothetical protein